MKGGTQRHGVDHEIDVVINFEPDDLQEFPGVVGSDGKHLGWVGLGFEIDDAKGMVEGMANPGVIDAVLVR